jgi:hypothetical protein
MDALLKAFIKRGLHVEVTEPRYKEDGPYRYYDRSPDSNATRVLVEGEWVVFGLKEKQKVVLADPPEPPRNLRGKERESWIRCHRSTRTYEFNGVLVLYLKNVDYVNVRKEWKDGVRTKLEGQPNDVVAHVSLAGEALKEKRPAAERAERERLEREIRKLEEDKRRREVERRAKVLLGQMERRRQAQAIREYAAEARRAWEASGGASEDDAPKVQEWFSWMEEYADRLDPLPRLEEEATEGLEPKHERAAILGGDARSSASRQAYACFLAHTRGI